MILLEVMFLRMYEKRKKRRIKKKNPKIYLEPDTGPSSLGAENNNDTTEDNDDNESGFEVETLFLLLVLNDIFVTQDNLRTEEDTSAVNENDTHSESENETNDDHIPQIIYDNSESDPGYWECVLVV